MPLDPTSWRDCTPYLHGLDLFNFGYYWEAHEAWEAVWHAAGRGGQVADFLKGLIKLAAAGVKAREGRSEGVIRHARRAQELFEKVAMHSADDCHFMGLSLEELKQVARQTAATPPRLVQRDHPPPVERVFDFELIPQ